MSDAALRGRRILVVEDVAVLAWLVEEMLAALGCEVVGPAARVSHALALVRETPLDFALLDINLVDEKSFPVADALVARNVPFVFVSASGRDALPDEHRSAALLQKPYDPSALTSVLAEALGAGEAGRATS